MTDHSLAVAAAFQACGVKAEVLPDSDQETLILGPKADFRKGMLSLHPDHRGHGKNGAAPGF